MIKKILLLLAVMAALIGNAGTWKIHSYYMTSKIQNAYDTGDKIYYLNSGSLFQFDKTTLETVSLNSQNLLSDTRSPKSILTGRLSCFLSLISIVTSTSSTTRAPYTM